MPIRSKEYERFIEKVKDISYLNQALSLLRWDEEVYMPPGTVKDRAQQVAILSALVHERMTSKAMARMVASLKKDKTLDEDQKVNVREFARDQKRATALPPKLVKELCEAETFAYEAWQKSRDKKDYKIFEPWLKRTLELKLKVAELVGYKDQPYDALLDEYEPLMLTRDLEAILSPFCKKLVPLALKIAQAAKESRSDGSFMAGNFDVEAQRTFFTKIVKDLGYSFDTGRLDVTVHPFTMGEAQDVRITTRYYANDLRSGLFSCIHEAGHGLYEQGTLEKNHHTPMGTGASLGIHESQSRIWENMVGRSRPFWVHYMPQMQRAFPSLGKVSLEDWYKAINMVAPSFIRIESDEVTYNLHIMLRFEIEKQMVNGSVTTSEVPAVWNGLTEKYLGITPHSDLEGCLQDVHWSLGSIGYFPTYTLGNLLAAQLYYKAQKDLPDMEGSFAKGLFKPFLGWLRKNIHQNGRKYKFLETCHKVTGKPLDEDNLVRYIKEKYGPLFGVRF